MAVRILVVAEADDGRCDAGAMWAVAGGIPVPLLLVSLLVASPAEAVAPAPALALDAPAPVAELVPPAPPMSGEGCTPEFENP